MKTKNKKKMFAVLLMSLLLSSCSLLSSGPSSVVKEFIADSQKGDVDALVSLWSAAAIKERGMDDIRKSAQGAVEFDAQIKAAGEHPQLENLRETVQGDRARVFFVYRDRSKKDQLSSGFALLKENGKWKIYRGLDISDEQKPFDSSFAPLKPRSSSSPEPNDSPMIMVSPPPPPGSSPANGNSKNPESSPSTNAGPVSAGSLNSKATSLPAPTYPPAARAVKAGGTVVVKVLVDESGNVMTADAVSGHPLLRSAAEQAARIAHFQPTLENGKRVKVIGTVTYQFTP